MHPDCRRAGKNARLRPALAMTSGCLFNSFLADHAEGLFYVWTTALCLPAFPLSIQGKKGYDYPGRHCHYQERMKHIRHCLESVKWVDEIVILDSGSTDDTVAICREYTDKFCDRLAGFRRTENRAMQKAACEWILSIDADESVSEALRREIEEAIHQPGNRVPIRFLAVRAIAGVLCAIAAGGRIMSLGFSGKGMPDSVTTLCMNG